MISCGPDQILLFQCRNYLKPIRLNIFLTGPKPPNSSGFGNFSTDEQFEKSYAEYWTTAARRSYVESRCNNSIERVLICFVCCCFFFATFTRITCRLKLAGINRQDKLT